VVPLVRRRAARVAPQRKGGRPSQADAGAELRDEIAQGAVSEAEVCSGHWQRLAFEDDGADRFVAPLQRLLGIDKKLLEPRVIHDRTSKLSLNCW
jgi:hypothetical protein